MFRFGKAPPRSLSSFGISGLLAKDCTVFYQSVFSTRQIGRISDLFAASLESFGVDELRLRKVLLDQVFEAYRTYLSTDVWRARYEDVLPEPMVIECGTDQEKVAIAISFTYPSDKFVQPDSIAELLKSKERSPRNEFEGLLNTIQNGSDRMVVKIQPSIRRMELVALFAQSGKMDLKIDSDSKAPEFILLEGEPDPAAPAKAYVELGDTDYQKLLREDLRTKRKDTPSQGEVLAQLAKQSLEEEEEKVEDHTLSDSIVKVVKGKKEDELEKIHVKGKAEPQDDEMMLVSGGTQGESGTETARERHYLSQINALQEKIRRLEVELQKQSEKQIRTNFEPSAEKEGHGRGQFFQKTDEGSNQEADEQPDERPDEQPDENSGEQPDEEFGEDSSQEQDNDQTLPLAQVFKKIWPFKRKESTKSSAESVSNPQAGEGNKEIPEKIHPEAKKAADASLDGRSEKAHAETVAAVQDLMLSMNGGRFDRTVGRIQNEAKAFGSDAKSPKLKKWLEGLGSDLLSEKARLTELSRKLNQNIRQKELEMKNKERILHDELKSREAIIKQKDNALARLKDQLIQSTLNLERVKGSGQSTVGEGLLKKKLDHARLLLDSQQEENLLLKKKNDELRDQLMLAKSHGAKGPSQAEMNHVKDRYDRLRRQSEELKKMVAELQDRAIHAEKLVAQKSDETTERLQRAMRIAVRTNRELERQRQETEKIEHEKKVLELRLSGLEARLKNKANPSGPGPASNASDVSAAANPSGDSGAANPSGESGAAHTSGALGSANPSGDSGAAHTSGALGSANPSGDSGASDDESGDAA